MEVLKYHRDHIFNSRNLLRVGDLISFDGPMFTLFKDVNSGALYLFDWVDRDQIANRWLVYRVTAKDLNEYVAGRLSHYDLFDRNPDRKIYFVDIDQRNKSFYHYDFYLLDSVPEHYLLLQKNYFDIDDCPAPEKIVSVIKSSLIHPSAENVTEERNLVRKSHTFPWNDRIKRIRSAGKPRKPEIRSIRKYNNVKVKAHFRMNLSLKKPKNANRNNQRFSK